MFSNKIEPVDLMKNRESTEETNNLISKHQEITAKGWSRPILFMIGYFLANLALTFHTKWLLSGSRFTFPWILSGLHISISGLGAWITLKIKGQNNKFKDLNWSLLTKIGLFSSLYSVNIAMSNVSMKYVSLALHQVTRSGTPLITLLLEFVILGKRTSVWFIISLIPVVLGIILTVIGEMDGFKWSTFGIFLTVLGVILSSLKGVMTNFMLVGGLKMNPLELIVLVAPLAAFQCLLASIITGESFAIYKQFHNNKFDELLMFGLLANGCLAFFLNWISFAVNKETSALAMTVAGNVKQAVSVGLAIIIFNTKLGVLNAIGILMTLIGGAWYR